MYKIYVDGSLFCSSEIEDLAIVNPEINQEVNKAGTFTFTLPPTHPYYDTIKKRTSIIDVYRDDDTEPLFEGVCIDSKTDFYKQKKLTCEGELTFLNDSKLRPQKYDDKTVRQLLESYISQHNAQTEAMKHFTVGQVTVSDSNNSIYCYSNYNSTMTEIKEDLVDDLGGFLRCRHEEGVRYLDYLAVSPRTNNQVIRLGENLLDLSQNIDTEEIATVIIPLGQTLDTESIEGLEERLTIKTAAADDEHPAGADYVYFSTAVNAYGYIEKVVVWDDVTTVAELLAKGKAYLSDIQFENLVIQAKAIDLGLTSSEFNKFKLLDMVRVVSAPHGLDRYFLLSKLQIHLNNPENDTITLGISESLSLTAKSQSSNSEVMQRIEQLPTSNMVQSAIDNATALITGADGGYVVITRNSDGQPTEIKIQDALNNPTKIWRWNVNGLGYSSDGGATYGLAMTMNGAIIADYITSGTMYADRIKGGTLTLGGTENVNGQIIMKNATGQTIGTWNKDGLNVSLGSISGATITGGTITGTTITGGTVSGATITGGTVSGATITSTSNNCTTTINGGVITLKPSGGSEVAINVESADGNYATRIYADQIKFGTQYSWYIGATGLKIPGITVVSTGSVTITGQLTCSSSVYCSGSFSCSSLTVGSTTFTNVSFLAALHKGTFWGTKPSNPTAQDAVNYTYSLVTALQGAGII